MYMYMHTMYVYVYVIQIYTMKKNNYKFYYSLHVCVHLLYMYFKKTEIATGLFHTMKNLGIQNSF